MGGRQSAPGDRELLLYKPYLNQTSRKGKDIQQVEDGGNQTGTESSDWCPRLFRIEFQIQSLKLWV